MQHLIGKTYIENYTPLAAKEAYIAKIPGSKLEIIEDSRHATAVEHLQQFNAIVAASWQMVRRETQL